MKGAHEGRDLARTSRQAGGRFASMRATLTSVAITSTGPDRAGTVVTADAPQTGDRILGIGEVKATRSPVGLNQLERLEHIRTLLFA
jgi:hypothetical protein